MKKFYLLFAMSVATFFPLLASDFSAVCPSGQTLYYNIVSNTEHTAEVSFPGSGGWAGYTKPSGNLTIPSTVTNGGVTYTITQIANQVFQECEITGVTIPNTITSIGNWAFFECDITSLHLPLSVDKVGIFAFSDNHNLSDITIANPKIKLDVGVFSYTSWYNNLDATVDFVCIGSVLVYYRGTNTHINIPSNVTSIAAEAFKEKNISSLTLPNNLKTIGAAAFYGCNGFSELTIPISVEYIGRNAFSNCGSMTLLNYKAKNAKHFSAYSYYGNNVGIFSGCDNLTTVNFDNGVKEIPDNAFCYCSRLNSLTLPDGISYIGTQSFKNCNGLVSLTIPKNVDSIGLAAFQQCINLQTVDYNAIDCNASNVFYGCSSLSSISIGNQVQVIPNSLFSDLPSITGNLIIPNSVITIGEDAFRNCSGITSVTIGTGVKYIGHNSFYETSISTVNFNATNCESGHMAFTGNILTTLNIGENVCEIPDFFVQGCPNLSSVSFPPSINKIGICAFYFCGLAGKLTIPSSVASIGCGAFANNIYLSDIECLATVPPTVETSSLYGGTYFFNGCWDKPLRVPCESIDAYSNALGWNNFTNICGIDPCNYTVEEDNQESVTVYAKDGKIIVNGANGELVSVFDMTGKQIAVFTAGDMFSNRLSPGIYFVRIGEKISKKIAVVGSRE